MNNHNKSKKHRSVLRQLGLTETHDLMEFVADVYDFPMDTICSEPLSFTPHLFMYACRSLKLCLSITLISCTHCWFHTGPTVVSLSFDDAMRVITEQHALGIDLPQCIRAMVKVKKVLNFIRCMCLIRMRSWANPSNYLGHCCWWMRMRWWQLFVSVPFHMT